MTVVINPRGNTYDATKANTERGVSRQIWSQSAWQEIKDLRAIRDGLALFDDFEDFPFAGAAQTADTPLGRYKVFSKDTGAVGAAARVRASGFPASASDLTADTTYPGGIIVLQTNTDNDSTTIALANSPFNLTTTNSGKLLFEARVATNSILTNMGQLFVGLAETRRISVSLNIPLVTTDAISNTGAMIGFNRLEDGLGVLNTSYADRAAVWTNIQAAAGAIAANTWIKLGMIFDPKDALRCIRFFINGVECATAMTRAALLALTNLDVVQLGPCVSFFADAAGTAAAVYVDWIACEQQF